MVNEFAPIGKYMVFGILLHLINLVLWIVSNCQFEVRVQYLSDCLIFEIWHVQECERDLHVFEVVICLRIPLAAENHPELVWKTERKPVWRLLFNFIVHLAGGIVVWTGLLTAFFLFETVDSVYHKYNLALFRSHFPLPLVCQLQPSLKKRP